MEAARDLGDFLDFIDWMFSGGGPVDLSGLLSALLRHPSFVFYLLVFIFLSVLVVMAVLRFGFPRVSRIGAPRWGGGVGLLAVLAAIVVLSLLQGGAYRLLRDVLYEPEWVVDSRSVLIATLLAVPIILALAGVFLRKAAHAGVGDFSVDTGSAATMGLNFLRGLLLMVVLVPLVSVVGVLNALFLETIGADMSEQHVVQMMREEASPLFAALLYFMVLFAAPVWEEFIFRGVLYNGLRRSLGRDEAILVSALIFGLIHGAVLAFLPIFLLAAFMAYAYERTGSLLAPIAMHFLYNLLNIILLQSA